VSKRSRRSRSRRKKLFIKLRRNLLKSLNRRRLRGKHHSKKKFKRHKCHKKLIMNLFLFRVIKKKSSRHYL